MVSVPVVHLVLTFQATPVIPSFNDCEIKAIAVKRTEKIPFTSAWNRV
jgi:hypothetical protein